MEKDSLRRIQRPRTTLEGKEFVLMRGDEELERCDDLMDAVGRQIAYIYGIQGEWDED